MEKVFIRLGKFFFKFRNAVFPILYLCLIVFTRPGIFLGNAQLDRYVGVLGVLIVLAGQIFRMLVIGFAYIRRGGKDGKVYASSLVQTGFYAHVRHPMYVGNYLIMLGFVLLYGSLWAYLLVLPFFTVVYYSLVKNEESYLKDSFGQEYEDYAANVNRFIPNFTGITISLERYHYDWKKVLRKEYGTITFVLCGLLAMIIWKDLTLFGYESKPMQIIILSAMFIPVVLFYGMTRYLKKTRQLR
jgi:protein-S-isoprenylcysteine O-methyltransferase Ste14